jgi:hypothetical protein
MRAGKPIADSESIQNHERLEGDSQIFLEGANDEGTISTNVVVQDPSGRHANLKLRRNASGRISKLEIDEIDASSEQEARRKARAIVHTLLDNVSFLLDVPVAIFQSDVFDPRSGNWNVTTRTPFPVAIWSDPVPMKPELNGYIALYREGITSQQPVYSFLCFLRISGGLIAELSKSRQLDSERSKTRAVPKSDDDIRIWARQVFPEWYRWNAFELASIAPPECRGLSFSRITETILSPLKAAIVQTLVASDAAVTMYDLAQLEQIDRWVPLLRAMARSLIIDASA